jgi:hypothetical protein
MSYLSYQQQCEDFSHHGDPEQEAYLSEMNARYDYIKELEAENADNFCEGEDEDRFGGDDQPAPQPLLAKVIDYDFPF